MNRTIFWRLVWKEYRLQRALWIAVVVLTILLGLLLLVVSEDPMGRENHLFFLALTMAACYALGCGAVLFAAERESGTYEFQRAIPVSSLRVFAAKATYAVASTLAMILAVVLVALLLSGGVVPGAEERALLVGTMGLGSLEVLAWGIFFSLRSARPLLAAILAVTVASTVAHVIAWNIAPVAVSARYEPTVPYRLVVLALVALADCWLGMRWLGPDRRLCFSITGVHVMLKHNLRLRRTGVSPVPVGSTGKMPVPTWGMTFSRLVWQQWRQSRRMLAALTLLAAVLLSIGAITWNEATSRLGLYRFTRGDWLVQAAIPASLPASILMALMGANVFLGDQGRRRFRFLAEHGAGPGVVWLTRQFVWLFAMVLASVVAAMLFVLAASQQNAWLLDPNRTLGYPPKGPPILLFPRGIGVMGVMLVLAYSAGQFCSMFFASGILAAVFGVILAGLLCGWAVLMQFLDINWLWSVGPIPVVLFLATRLRTNDWLLERNRFSGWLRVGLLLAVPAIAIVTPIPRVRVSAIPSVPESLAAEIALREPTAEERETEDMFQRALLTGRPRSEFRPQVEFKPGDQEPTRDPISPPKPWEIAWLKANGNSLALTLKATRRPVSNDPHRVRLQNRPAGEWALSDLLEDAGWAAQAEGKLDEAMDYYLAAMRLWRHIAVCHESWRPYDEWLYDRVRAWVAAPGQTAERVGAMLREVTKVIEPPVSRTLDIQSHYHYVRELIDGNPTTMANAGLHKGDAAMIAIWNRWLPWERQRALRVLDYTADSDLYWCRRLEDALARGESCYSAFSGQRWGYYRDRRPLTLALEGYLDTQFNPGAAGIVLRPMVDAVARQREVRLMLAIEAWKLQHGHLPKTLDELVGPYLKAMPHDPYTGEPFRYFPEGFPLPLMAMRSSQPTVLLEAHTPFLWSAGHEVRVDRNRVSDDQTFTKYLIAPTWSSGVWHSPQSEQEVWQMGRIYRLP